MIIYKYPLSLVEHQTIPMPVGAQILTLEMQGSTPCIWAAHSEFATEMEPRTFVLVPTGVAFEPMIYIGTIQRLDGLLVFHLYEKQ